MQVKGYDWVQFMGDSAITIASISVTTVIFVVLIWLIVKYVRKK